MDIEQLSIKIFNVHHRFYTKVIAAVNVSLTIRNWWIGAYIVEYEQNGEDRANYGDELIVRLVKKISIKGLSETNLRICRQFYNCYPQIYMAIQNNTNFNVIHQSLPDELYNIENKDISIHQSLPDELKIVENINKKILILSSQNIPNVAPEKLITKLSLTHISELVKIENPLKRVFYPKLFIGNKV